MRFNAAMHALARRGRPDRLQSLYRRRHEDFDGAVGAAMAEEDAFIAAWMRDPPQTNEVSRAAAIRAALMVAQRKIRLPFELIELGSSAGLNLNLAHYGFELGGRITGITESPVQIAPKWRGPPPPDAPVEIIAARGVDLHPLDASDEATRERLLSFVFADQPARAACLREALAIAQRHKPRIDRADAASWLAERLRMPQEAGRCRAVFHSMVMQYLEEEDRRSVDETIAAAGARASAQRPLIRIAFEWTPARTEVQLWLTCWPTGEARQLATCHPYGAWVDWKE